MTMAELNEKMSQLEASPETALRNFQIEKLSDYIYERISACVQ
jgi:hypothetical protein